VTQCPVAGDANLSDISDNRFRFLNDAFLTRKLYLLKGCNATKSIQKFVLIGEVAY